MLNIIFILLISQLANAETWRLTIDDGPNKHTLAIAQRLKELKCPATFFVCGSLYPYKDELKWIVDNGFGIGNHSRSHKYDLMRKGGYPDIRSDLRYISDYVRTNFGVTPREFRAPYGAYGNTVMNVMNELKLLPSLWTSGIGDAEWAEPGDPRYDPEKIFEIACTVGRFPAAGRNVLLIHSTRWELHNIDALVGVMRKHGEIVLEF